MALQTIPWLKNQFKTGLKPLQQDFWDWLDSYYHKSEELVGEAPNDGKSYVRKSKAWSEAGNRVWQILNTDLSPAMPSVNYLIDASNGMKNIELPAVTAGNNDRFYFTLNKNSHHCKITVIGGVQLIGGNLFLGMATVNGYVELVANGVDGYNIVVDGRVYDRVVNVTDNLDLSSGYESGGLYNFQLQTSQSVVLSIPNAKEEHVGMWATFSKHVGDNASARIVSQNGLFDEVINDNDTGFTIVTIYDEVNDEYDYVIKQNSRPSASNIAVNFLPVGNPSTIEPTYNILETESQIESILVSIPITSTDPNTPTSLGFFINDNKALFGLIPDTNINAYAQIKKSLNFNRNVQIKFKYYEYDYGTLTLNPVALSETSFSSVIDDYSVFEQKQVGGTLPANTWAEGIIGKTLVIELLAIKVGSGGVEDDPTLDFRTGGTAPSKTTVNIPASNINHNTLGGVSTAGVGVDDGHVNSAMYKKLFATLELLFSAAPVFDLDEGSIQEMPLSGSTVPSLLNKQPGTTYITTFAVDGVGGYSIAPDSSYGDKSANAIDDITSAVANAIYIFTIVVRPNGATLYTLEEELN